MRLKYLKLLPAAAIVAPILTSCHSQDPTIKEVYDLLKTPVKYGAVIKDEEYYTDSPTVFSYNGKWYMTYIHIKKETSDFGYETLIAESTDLIHWSDGVIIFKRQPESSSWDSQQIAGYMGFVDNDLFGNHSLQKVCGKHYIPYLGGSKPGYETDPLWMGQAWCGDDIMNPESYHKFAKPILTPDDTDARPGEDYTLYKSNMFVDEAKTLGYKYVNFYNAKGKDNVEAVFVAVSDDAIKWMRYGPSYVFKDMDAQITGDPIILKYKNTYIMVYYTLKNGKTCDTFAISKDLVNWTKWDGEPLIKSEYDWENKYAHKPSIVYKDGILYHFYCAVNKIGDNPEERFIAVATSKPLK